MPDPDPRVCGRVRRSLVERATELVVPPRSAEVATHLDGCPTCRTFARHLEVARDGFRDAPAVHPALRQRTLAAVARRSPLPRWVPFWTLPAALLLGVVLSFAVPLWLAERVLHPVFGSSPWTLALGLAAVCSQALAAGAAPVLVVALRRRPAGPTARPVLEA